MKIVCTRDNLRQGISRVERAVGRNSTLPVLASVLLETEKGLLKISATNLEIGVISYVRSRVENEGKTTVPVSVFSGIIHNLKDEKITLELVGTSLKIFGDTFESKLRTISADDFPLIPKVEDGLQWRVNAKDLKEATRRVMPSVSNLETKLELTGVCFSAEEKTLTMASTDGYRLAEKTIKCEGKTKEASNFIVPGSSLQEVERIFGEESVDVLITVSENQIAFQKEDVYFVSRLIEGKYPDYKQIIPNKFKAEVRIEKTKLLDSLKMASIFSLNQTKDVKIGVEPEKISIHTGSGDFGEHHAEIPAEVNGESFEVSFNHQFLQDGLNTISEEDVMFFLNDSNGASLMKGFDNKKEAVRDDFLYIVMPIRQ